MTEFDQVSITLTDWEFITINSLINNEISGY